MNEIRPINDNVLVELDQQVEQKTVSGIYLPDTAKEKKLSGKVLAIGNIENSELNVGDTVLYKEHAGTKVEFDKKEFLIIQYADILAKIVETEEI